MTSLLLVGQLLALSGAMGKSGPLEVAHRLMEQLPTKCEDAICKSMAAFRAQLLSRLGIEGVIFGQQPLLLYPESTQYLLDQFDEATDEKELDSRLNTAGLQMWTRSGELLSVDLRSTFMDYLDIDTKHLPYQQIEKSGEVRAFVQRLHRLYGTNCYIKAAEVVEANRDANGVLPATIAAHTHPSTQFLAVVFAYVEIAKSKINYKNEEACRSEIYRLLGYSDWRTTGNNTNRLKRIIQKAGYEKDWTKINEQLRQQQVPPRLVELARWYLTRQGVERNDWPRICWHK
jgi:hypothetical protein